MQLSSVICAQRLVFFRCFIEALAATSPSPVAPPPSLTIAADPLEKQGQDQAACKAVRKPRVRRRKKRLSHQCELPIGPIQQEAGDFASPIDCEAPQLESDTAAMDSEPSPPPYDAVEAPPPPLLPEEAIQSNDSGHKSIRRPLSSSLPPPASCDAECDEPSFPPPYQVTSPSYWTFAPAFPPLPQSRRVIQANLRLRPHSSLSSSSSSRSPKVRPFSSPSASSSLDATTEPLNQRTNEKASLPTTWLSNGSTSYNSSSP